MKAMKAASSLLVACAISGALGLSDLAKTSVRRNLGDHRVVSLKQDHISEELRTLLLENDADHFGSDVSEETGESLVHLKLSPAALRALRESRVDFEDSTERWVNELEKNYNDPKFFCYDGDEACSDRSLEDFYSSYQTRQAINKRLNKIKKKSNGLAKVKSIGKSYEGKKMKVIHIGNQTKPLVFYMCNIHAREWLPPMYCTYMAEMLVANGEGHELLDRFSFTILPVSNPDGYDYTQEGNTMWRKTRKPNPGTSCIGTDGNRNWADHHCGRGASTNPCDITYCGEEPFDNPETEAISKFGESVKDRLFSFADIHSYGGYWMSPYGWTYNLPPAQDFDRMEACFEAAADAVEATHGRRFITGSSANAIYIAAGGSDDWFYSALGVIYSFSVELRGNQFQPPASNIMPSNEEIFAGMQASLDCAYDIEFGQVRDLPLPDREAPDQSGGKEIPIFSAGGFQLSGGVIAMLSGIALVSGFAVAGMVSVVRNKLRRERSEPESKVPPAGDVELVNPPEQIEKQSL